MVDEVGFDEEKQKEKQINTEEELEYSLNNLRNPELKKCVEEYNKLFFSSKEKKEFMEEINRLNEKILYLLSQENENILYNEDNKFILSLVLDKIQIKTLTKIMDLFK